MTSIKYDETILILSRHLVSLLVNLVSSNCPISYYFISHWLYVSLILICLSDCDCFFSFLYLVFYFTFVRRYTHGIIKQRYTHGIIKQRYYFGNYGYVLFHIFITNMLLTFDYSWRYQRRKSKTMQYKWHTIIYKNRGLTQISHKG